MARKAFFACVLFGIAIICVFCASFFSGRLSPISAFITLTKTVELDAKLPNRGSSLIPLFDLAMTDLDLRPWVTLLNAKMLIRRGADDLAVKQGVEVLRSIPNSHPSSLDARLEILRMVYFNKALAISEDTKTALLAFTLDLEKDAAGSKRTDILLEIAMLRAELAEIQGEVISAFATLSKARESCLDKACVKLLREKISNLMTKHESSIALSSVADIYTEVLSLFKEGSYSEAESLIQKYMEGLSTSSLAYQGLLKLELNLLFRLQNYEADMDKLFASVLSHLGLSREEAALEKAKFPDFVFEDVDLTGDLFITFSRYFFSKGKFDISLSYLDRLSKVDLFSSVDPSVSINYHYMRGRIQEEVGRADDAIALYRSIPLEITSPTVLSVMRRLSWLCIKKHDYPCALENFNKVVDSIETHFLNLQQDSYRVSEISDVNFFQANRDEIENEYLHALYWFAQISLNNDKTSSNSEDMKQGKDRAYRIITQFPSTYYSFLANKLLKSDIFFGLDRSKISQHLCAKFITDNDFVNHVEKLNQFGLQDLAIKEVNWYFYRNLARYSTQPVDTTTLTYLKPLAMSQIFSDLGLLKDSVHQLVNLADSLPASLLSVEDTTSRLCYLNSYFQLSYPIIPLETNILEILRTRGISRSLFFAVTREDDFLDFRLNKSSSIDYIDGAMNIREADKTDLMSRSAIDTKYHDKDLPLLKLNLSKKRAETLASLLERFNRDEIVAGIAYRFGLPTAESLISKTKGTNDRSSDDADLEESEFIESIDDFRVRSYAQQLFLAKQMYMLIDTDPL